MATMSRVNVEGQVYEFMDAQGRSNTNNVRHSIDVALNGDAGQGSKATRKNGYFDIPFSGSAVAGQKIHLELTVPSGTDYVLYKKVSDTEELVTARPSGNYTWDYTVEKGETVIGVHIWVSDASGDVTFNWYYTISDALSNALTSAVDIDETIDNVKKTAYYFMFDRPLVIGQKLQLDASITSNGSEFILYEIYDPKKIKDKWIQRGIDHCSVTLESTPEKTIYGFYIYVSTANPESTLKVKAQAKDVVQMIRDTESISGYLSKDISINVAAEVATNTSKAFWLPYPLFPGQELNLHLELNNDGGFYLYKLLDRYDIEKRQVVQSAKNVSHTTQTFIGDENETIYGFYVWVNDAVAGSTLNGTIIAKSIANASEKGTAIIPEREIVPVLANFNYDMNEENQHFTHKPFTFIHFSDMHGDTNALKRIIDFNNKYSQYIQAVVHSGDAVPACYEEGYPSIWSVELAGGNRILEVIGNHEAYTNGLSGCKSWSVGYSAKQCYTRYIAPMADEVDSVADKCYWSKVFADSNIMMIAIDNYHWKEVIRSKEEGYPVLNQYPNGDVLDHGEQAAWFISKLEEARTAGYFVIVTCHNPSNIDRVDCSFNTLDPMVVDQLQTEAINAVQDFIDNGGHFISWICGHSHVDYFGPIKEHPDQLMICIDKAGCNAESGLPWTGVARVADTRSENLFNIVSVETDFKIISLFRIGSEYDKYGRHIGQLVYDYGNHKLLWNT